MTEPPHPEEFSRWRAVHGGRSARIDIAGLAIELHGLPSDLQDHVMVRYAAYVSAATGVGRPLRVEVLQAPHGYFLPPRFATENETYRMLTRLDGPVFRTVSYRLASWVDVRGRRGQIAFSRGDLDPQPRALENFLRSSIAWMAQDAGGFFLHGASIVRKDRCYLFYGPTGAGKSTLAAQSREGRVISDDLTLVLRSPSGLSGAGGPFRGTYTLGEPVVGTFPVAGLYRLRKDVRTWLEKDDGGCFADLAGNLPFVVDQLPRHPEILDRLRGLVTGLPMAYLHFSVDADFWPAIDSGLGG